MEVADHVEDRGAVTVGLDVHKLSVRLAAVSAGEVIAEQTMVHDHGVVLAAVGVWPGARVCQQAGPAGFGLHRALVALGIDSCRARAGSGFRRGREIV